MWRVYPIGYVIELSPVRRGPVLNLFFTDSDGLEGEVCVPNPDAQPDVRHPPGTPAARFDAP